jgi:hypothetical protein
MSMKQHDPLELVQPGSLERPGAMGRIVRLVLGIACFYALYELITYRAGIISTPVSALPNIALLVLVAFLIINYVVNIGFGRSWRRWPSLVSVAAMLVLAAVSWLSFGTPDHVLLGFALWVWLIYFFAHLGSSFVLSAIIATPGCEMRSIPELYGRMTGRPSREHHCPASLISKIDAWEQGAGSGDS